MAAARPILNRAEAASGRIPVGRSSSAEERLMALADGGRRLRARVDAALGELGRAEGLTPGQLRAIRAALDAARGLADAAIDSDVR